jgi:hypothetical protein
MRQLRRALAHIVGQRERIWVTTAGAIFDHVAGFLPGTIPGDQG